MENSLLDSSFDGNWRVRSSGACGQEAPQKKMLQEIKTKDL